MSAVKLLPSGGYLVRKKLPSDVRGDYKRLHGQAFEAKLYLPAGTAPNAAKQQGAEFIAQVESRIAAIRATRSGQGISLTPVEARKLAGELYVWLLERTPEHEWEGIAEALGEAVVDAAGPLLKYEEPEVLWRENPQVRAELRPVLEDIAHVSRFLGVKSLALNNEARAMLTDYLFEDLKAALSNANKRAGGDFSTDAHRKQFGVGAPAIGHGMGLLPKQLLEKWAKDRKPAGSTIENYRSFFRVLEEHFAGRSVASIEPEEAQQFVDALITPERSAATVRNNWLRALNAVCEWAKRKKLLPRNPFAEVVVEAKKRKRTRDTKAFHADEARTILAAALATKDTTRPLDATKRWVPWICAYTGARSGEACQLRGCDVFKRDGVWCMQFSPDAGSIKTDEVRVVPIHEHLIAQGFLEFVKTKGDGPLFYKPRTAKANPEASVLDVKKSPASQMRQRLADWIRNTLNVTDKELQPNHAWRHSFKSRARRAGIEPGIRDAICGHSSRTVADEYEEPTLEDTAEALKKFPRWEID